MPPDWQGQRVVVGRLLPLHRYLLFLLCCHPLLSHQRPPGRRRVGAELGLPPPPHSRTTLSLLNAISPPPVARPRLIFPSFHPVFPPSASLPLARAASSHVPDLLINKPRRSSSAFPPPPLPVFHFEARCQTELPFSLGSIAQETWLPRLPLFPLHLRHPFIALAARSLAQFSPPTSAITKKIQRSSNFLVLTRDL